MSNPNKARLKLPKKPKILRDPRRSVKKTPEIEKIKQDVRKDQPEKTRAVTVTAPAPNVPVTPPIAAPIAESDDDVLVPVLSPIELVARRNQETIKLATEIVKTIQSEILEDLKMDPGSVGSRFDVQTFPQDAINIAVASMLKAGWNVRSDGAGTIMVDLPVVPQLAAPTKRHISKVRPL